MDAPRAALLDEAMKKSGLVWITVADGRASPAWYVWRGSPEPAAYVLTGGGEQPVPGLADAAAPAGAVTVAARSKDTGALLVTWTATPYRVPPGSAEWSEILPDLQAKRLNPPDGLDAPTRWARDSHLIRLTPTGELAIPATRPAGTGRRGVRY